MPMIIEHLHSDDEYLESIAYLKARLEKAGIRYVQLSALRNRYHIELLI